ncbi:MAG TPA: DUF3124 domain-containing protein [Candidatus Hydrogenedentes bacterium]|nr:DUF3124 domain-containing protein [Candidatus Hydrogenedentota bacterium]
MSEPESRIVFTTRAFKLLLAAACGIVIVVSVPLFIIAHALEGGFDRFERNAAYLPPPPEKLVKIPSDAAGTVGQTVYVPVYSHIYIQDGRAYRLAATLSIRNADPMNSMVVKAVRYYDTEGKLIRNYLEQPLKIDPLATSEFFVEEKDVHGGSGAKFLVDWTAQQAIHPPIIESIMIGAEGQQGISFARSGIVIADFSGDSEKKK